MVTLLALSDDVAMTMETSLAFGLEFQAMRELIAFFNSRLMKFLASDSRQVFAYLLKEQVVTEGIYLINV